MKEAPTSSLGAPVVSDQPANAFESLERTLQSSGAQAAIEQLITHLDTTGAYGLLLDALLLKARRELDLPLLHFGNLSSLPEPARTRYEERYV
ncbi:MAG: hypothetical protein ACP5XB_32080, partial [Isosphaeraceae bacterium]